MNLQRDERISGNLDWPTTGLFFLLVLMGWFNIYAVVYDETSTKSLFDLSTNSGRQMMFIGAAMFIIIIILIIDLRFYETIAYVIFGVAIFVLILVPIIGKEVGGNKSWLGIGSFGVQPSEFAKFATALAVAKFIGSVGFRMDNMRNQAVLFAMIGVPIALILLQKDFGTALVFGVFLLTFYREGMSPFLLVVGTSIAALFILTLLVPNRIYLEIAIIVVLGILILLGRKTVRRIVILGLGAVIIIGFVESTGYIINNVLKPHHRDRIKVLINPDSDPLGGGWNVTQSKIAIGSGGFMGKGYLSGTQTKFDFVPKQSTDFIFCTIGEEFGWIGSLAVIGLFIALILRVVHLAERQKNRFARVYGYSVASLFFAHFAINIGMTIGLFPVVGIPLPFFSYGGSALWSFTILLFILLKLDANRGQVLQRMN
ncbi:MAG TPA: rod shape-determining protein RodA [Cyclobacteriaceae bacterium]|nr:rod shape-determining protein RodA [Cyclobacteriaceae bacterium]